MECWNDGMLGFYTELLYSQKNTSFLRKQESRLVPVKTGNQCFKDYGFPRIKYGAGLVKPGMTNCTGLMLLYLSLTQYSTIPVFHYSMENSHG